MFFPERLGSGRNRRWHQRHRISPVKGGSKVARRRFVERRVFASTAKEPVVATIAQPPSDTACAVVVVNMKSLPRSGSS